MLISMTSSNGRSSGVSELCEQDESGPSVPTIVFHGDHDMIVNINGDRVIAQSKAAANLRTTVSRGEALLRSFRTIPQWLLESRVNGIDQIHET
jgi:hypothetical protein